MSNFKPTGIPELDKVLSNDDGLTIEPMDIDKSIFDNILLPLLTNEVNLPNDEAFNHVKTIWINYHSNKADARAIGYKKGNGVEYRVLKGNAVFTPFRIVDKGEVVDITPPLVEPQMIEGSSHILEEYSNELKHNPDVAKAKLVNTISKYTLSTNNKWIEFINRYNNGKSINDDSNDDLLIIG